MRKVLSAVLAFVVLLNCAAVSVYAVDGCNCKNIPSLHVPGIGATLYENPGSAERTVVFPPDGDAILNAVKEYLPELLRGGVTRDWKRAADKLSETALELFDKFRCDNKGNPLYPETGVKAPDRVTSPQADHAAAYTYQYDWRLDPMTVADGLNDYIEKICAATGHDKIKINAHSEGGMMVMAYLGKYGTERVQNLQMLNTAFQGLSLNGELFTGSVNVDGTKLADYIGNLIPDEPKWKILIQTVDTMGAFAVVGGLLGCAVNNMWSDVMDSALVEIFGHIPALWGFVPDEYYEKAKTYMFGNNPDYDYLKNRLDDYHYNIQCKAKNILDGLVESGAGLTFIIGYNLQSLPLTNAADNQSDALIDTKYSSGGATCAKLHKTLGKDYAQKVDCGHNHVSPDNKLDASSCMFPEYTWFVEGMDHWGGNAALEDYLYNFDGQPNVRSNPEFPQFLTLDDEGNIKPLVVQKTALDRLNEFLQSIIDFIVSYFPMPL